MSVTGMLKEVAFGCFLLQRLYILFFVINLSTLKERGFVFFLNNGYRIQSSYRNETFKLDIKNIEIYQIQFVGLEIIF